MQSTNSVPTWCLAQLEGLNVDELCCPSQLFVGQLRVGLQ